MLIKLWGVRGSIPAPLRNAEYQRKLKAVLREWQRSGPAGEPDEETLTNFISGLSPDLKYTYGGDTTCVTVQLEENHMPLILDCGTGLRVLGDDLMDGPCGRGQGELRLFLTHTHWDHIQGLPFFKPAYIPGNKLTFYSPYGDLEERLVGQQQSSYFPMPFHGTASEKSFQLMEPGRTVELEGGTLVDGFALKHPGGSYAYRFRKNGQTFIFATDCEFTGEDMEASANDEFFQDADLLVMDAQYTLDESFKKFDWGHTSFTMAVNCAVKWRVKHLVMTHHEPAYQDFQVFRNHVDAIQHKDAMPAGGLMVHAAREGMTIRLGPKR